MGLKIFDFQNAMADYHTPTILKNMSLPGFEPGTPAFLSDLHRKNVSDETISYKSSALTRLSYRLI